MAAVSSLRLSQKILLFEPRKHEALFPSEPVAGEKTIVLGCDDKALVALDRRDLSVMWRARVSSLNPLYWWSEDLLVLGGGNDVAMWDARQKRVLWRAKTRLIGGKPWNGLISTWPTLNDIELREATTGRVQRGFKVVGPGTICGELLICRSIEKGDPVQALRPDGRVAWQRDLVAEVRSQSVGAESEAYLVALAGSTPGRFVATFGHSCFGCSSSDGKIIWKVDVPVPYYSPFEGGRILILEGERFVVIDEAAGGLLCDRRYPELRPMYHVKRGSILGDLVVFVSESGHVAVFDLKDGSLISLEHHKRLVFWGTAVADGRLLVSGADGKLWVYESAAPGRAGPKGDAGKDRTAQAS